MVATLVSVSSPLQTPPSTVALLGTVGLLALFLSLTAHLAARNVLGDVSLTKAVGVGTGPAVVSLLTQLLSIPSVIGLVVALAVDGVAIHLLYDQSRRRSAYITFIHAIISVILGTVLVGGLIIAVSLPG